MADELNYLLSFQPKIEQLMSSVETSGIFQDFCKTDLPIYLAGRRHCARILPWNDDFGRFMNYLSTSIPPASPFCRWDVVSWHWSARHIEAILEDWFKCNWYQGPDRPKVIANEIREVANIPSILADEGRHSTRRILRIFHCVGEHGLTVLWGPEQKLNAIEKSLAKDDRPQLVVYIGCATTDIPCLVRYGGVLVGTGEVTQRTSKLLQSIGFPVPHINDWVDEHICWARNFDDLRLSYYMREKIYGF